MSVNTFYRGLNTTTKQFIKIMCNGEFLSKDVEDAWEYSDSLTKNSQASETEDALEKSQSIDTPRNRGGLIKLGETEYIATRLISHKVDDLLAKRWETLKIMVEVQEICDICEIQGHITRSCPTPPAFK